MFPGGTTKKQNAVFRMNTAFCFLLLNSETHYVRERYEISQNLRNIDLADIGNTDQIGKDARSRNTCTCTITLDLHRILLVALGGE